MRIFLVCDIYLGVQNAPSIHMMEVMKNIMRQGHDVLLFAPKIRRSQEDISQVKYVPSIDLPVIRHIIYQVLLPFYLLHFWLVSRPDVIYGRFFPSTLSCGIFAKLTGTPYIVEINDIVPKLISMQDKSRLLVLASSATMSLNLRLADRIVAITDGIKKELQMDYGVDSKKIVVIQNGANTDLFSPADVVRAELGLEDGLRYVCFVGAFEPWQGIEDLLSAVPIICERCPEVRFLLVGDGPLYEKLLDLSKKSPISDKIIFTGLVPYEKVPRYINASDICIAPKRPLSAGYSPLKLYEYAACAKPVVASRLPGFEFLKSEGAGSLFSPNDPQDLADIVIRLLEDDAARKEMGILGRRYVCKYHSWKICAKKVIEVCESAIR